MSALELFDPSVYTRTPNLDLPSYIALGHQLLQALPARPSSALKASADELATGLAEAEQCYGEHLQIAVPQDNRVIDQAADVSWGSLYRWLSAYAELPHDRYPKAVQAEALLQALFPSGLGFLNSEYGAQWTEAEQRLRRISRDKLKPVLLALGGGDFLTEIERCHKDYGEMVGVTKVKTPRSKLPDLRAQRQKLQQALTAHMFQLVAMVLAGGASAYKAALPSFAAIDAYREKAAPSGTDKKPTDPTPLAPSPAQPA
ncbi:MAG: hypothetical protein JNM40_10985 [Myxococcales bacterium]|nr:hypothetical protein [Myxococcales bacterium]